MNIPVRINLFVSQLFTCSKHIMSEQSQSIVRHSANECGHSNALKFRSNQLKLSQTNPVASISVHFATSILLQHCVRVGQRFVLKINSQFSVLTLTFFNINVMKIPRNKVAKKPPNEPRLITYAISFRLCCVTNNFRIKI